MYLGVALNFWYPLMTLFTASRKSFSVTVFLRARMANMPASVHTLLISAPEGQTQPYDPIVQAVKVLDLAYRAWKKGQTKSTM
ncbi:hypothetical protein CFP56_024869 [Quercus suber]|uniref:Uncharacterized protein n=1 Tax=Quercus suber TaxID=58331 RepID=A0AAW0K4D2_QUESU